MAAQLPGETGQREHKCIVELKRCHAQELNECNCHAFVTPYISGRRRAMTSSQLTTFWA